jgi:hypothetical protein
MSPRGQRCSATFGSLARTGIYGDDGAGRPTGNPVVDGGTVATDAGGPILKTFTISKTLSATTLFWLAYVPSDAGYGLTP